MPKDIIEIASDCGFECIGAVDTGALEVRQEVRDMCAADKCHSYGRNWSCPPACGDISDFAVMIASRDKAVLVQSVGKLEDDFDIETMEETMAIHKDRFSTFVDEVRKEYPGALFLSAGACNVCKTCPYPETPCRFPEKSYISMEASGLVVIDVCNAADIPYPHVQQ
ncbi:MAG: DUF2284 domain-containing protein, partial [Actinobacteria bacterium]|nr:DUF2284 domain-containing protein [Actinomycetota bacterium]